MVKERGPKAMGKEEEVTKEVMQLLERIKGELRMKEQESTKMIDPFKDLLHFFESPSDIDDVNQVVEVSDEDVHQCSQCKITFENSTDLSSHMKKVHKGISKETQKKGTETKKKETAMENKKGTEASPMEDAWAEMPGGIYQCLVCLASGLAWERRQLTEHLAIHKLTLVQYHNVFGPAIQRQLTKEREKDKKTNNKVLVKENKNRQTDKQTKDDKEDELKEVTEDMPTKEEESNKEIIAIPGSPRSKKRRPPQPLKKFECNICKDVFLWKEPTITDHLYQKHSLTKEFYFNLYVKGVENSEDKFNCNTCLFSCTRKSALTFHVNKYHSATEKRSCCKKKVKTKWDLFVHLIENHKNDKDLFAKMDMWQSLEKYYLKTSA